MQTPVVKKRPAADIKKEELQKKAAEKQALEEEERQKAIALKQKEEKENIAKLSKSLQTAMKKVQNGKIEVFLCVYACWKAIYIYVSYHKIQPWPGNKFQLYQYLIWYVKGY